MHARGREFHRGSGSDLCIPVATALRLPVCLDGYVELFLVLLVSKDGVSQVVHCAQEVVQERVNRDQMMSDQNQEHRACPDVVVAQHGRVVELCALEYQALACKRNSKRRRNHVLHFPDGARSPYFDGESLATQGLGEDL